MNEIVHLQRDLHANDFALVKKNTTVELERFNCLSLCQRESPSLNAGSLLPLTFAMQLSTSVSWRWRCVFV